MNDSPWRSDDRYAWVFRDRVDIEPVPCKGSQKLWVVPPAIADVVRERYQKGVVVPMARAA